MKEFHEFSLEKQEGPYDRWPSRTRLLRHGLPTGTRVPGYFLHRQYELPGPRYLLVVDMDCPWEETTLVLLLDADLRVVSKVRFGLPWGFYNLHEATVVDERTLDLALGAQGVWRVSVQDERRWLFGSFLRALKISPHRCLRCSPQVEEEHENQAVSSGTLRIVRQRGWHAAGGTLYVVLDGVDLGVLSKGEETQFTVDPGSHVLVVSTWSGPWSNHLPLSIAPGETVHVEVTATGNYAPPEDPGLRCSILRHEATK